MNTVKLKITKIQAKRLAEYMEDKMGWTVFNDERRCQKLGHGTSYNKFCGECGAATVEEYDRDVVLEDLMSALEHAFSRKALL